MVTISVTGTRAASIQRANNASFYGVNKIFGDLSNTAPGRKAAEDAVRDYLTGNGIAWNSFDIVRTRTIDTAGTPVPYKAEINFNYD